MNKKLKRKAVLFPIFLLLFFVVFLMGQNAKAKVISDEDAIEINANTAEILKNYYAPDDYLHTAEDFFNYGGICKFEFEGKEYIKEIYSTVDMITKNCKTTEEKALAIHDWISVNIDYPIPIEDYNSLPTHKFGNPYMTFKNRLGVCYGFANLTSMMMQRAGVPCVVLRGPTPMGVHVWNAIYYNKEWRFIDNTWDSNLTHSLNAQGISYKYWLMSKNETEHAAIYIENCDGDSCTAPVETYGDKASEMVVINFELNGGIGVKRAIINKSIECYPHPQKAGYDFGGWYKKDGTKISEEHRIEGCEVTPGETFYARWGKDISKTTITLEKSTYEFTSDDIEPDIIAKDGNKTLVKNKDYKLSYKDNWSPGTATITVEGMGDYVNSVKKEFIITKKVLPLPEEGKTFEYDRTRKKIYESSFLCDVSGEYSEKNAGEYTVRLSLPFTHLAEWEDGTTEDKIIHWRIVKAHNYFVQSPQCSSVIEGNRLQPYAEAMYGTVIFEFRNKATDEICEHYPMEPGEYIMKAYVADHNNYSALQKEVDVSIFKKDTASPSDDNTASSTPDKETESTPLQPPKDKTTEPSPSQNADKTKQMGADGTVLGAGASAEVADEAITSMKSDTDPKGSEFGKLQLKSAKQTKTSIKVQWKKIKRASAYIVYGNACGKKSKMKKLASTKGKAVNFKKIAGKNVKKGTYYKFLVVAIDKNNKVVSVSKLIHVATKGGKAGNPKAVIVKAKIGKKTKSISQVKVKKGKSIKLKVTLKAAEKKLNIKKHVAPRFESSNTNIAVVTKKGLIKAKAKGRCKIYVYAQNGVCKTMIVAIK